MKKKYNFLIFIICYRERGRKGKEKDSVRNTQCLLRIVSCSVIIHSFVGRSFDRLIHTFLNYNFKKTNCDSGKETMKFASLSDK